MSTMKKGGIHAFIGCQAILKLPQHQIFRAMLPPEFVRIQQKNHFGILIYLHSCKEKNTNACVRARGKK